MNNIALSICLALTSAVFVSCIRTRSCLFIAFLASGFLHPSHAKYCDGELSLACGSTFTNCYKLSDGVYYDRTAEALFFSDQPSNSLVTTAGLDVLSSPHLQQDAQIIDLYRSAVSSGELSILHRFENLTCLGLSARGTVFGDRMKIPHTVEAIVVRSSLVDSNFFFAVKECSLKYLCFVDCRLDLPPPSKGVFLLPHQMFEENPSRFPRIFSSVSSSIEVLKFKACGDLMSVYMVGSAWPKLKKIEFDETTWYGLDYWRLESTHSGNGVPRKLDIVLSLDGMKRDDVKSVLDGYSLDFPDWNITVSDKAGEDGDRSVPSGWK